MRRGLLIVIGLCLICGYVMADSLGTGGESQAVYSVYFRNDTGDYADYLVPTTTIRPNVDKLWGYDFMSLVDDGHMETRVVIFDSTSSAMSGECYGEKESDGKESIHDRWLQGRKVLNGVALRIGAFTEGQLLFIRE